MVTILLQKIIALLTGWLNAFTEHATNVLSKLNLIEEDTSNLPDIKTNTDSIVSNTASVITPINNIKSNTDSIKTNTDSIKNDTAVIKNNINTISTNTGTASAFCEDTANNTLEIVDKITTIASDTTQLRTNSNSISSDVSEIKNTLGLYLYNTIVTEDSEGAIANFDTDLKDYLQEAKVVIPADVGGISGINLSHYGKNILNLSRTNIITSATTSATTPRPFTENDIWVGITRTNVFHNDYILSYSVGSNYVTVNNNNSGYGIGFPIKCKPSTNYVSSSNSTYNLGKGFYDVDGNYLSNTENATFTTPSNCYWILIVFPTSANTERTYTNPQLEVGAVASDYERYNGETNTVTFTTPITDGAEVDLLSGIIKINTNPVTYDSITPIAIRTFKGVNNIYSDIGDMSVTYRETLKHYLEKQNS